MMIYTAQRPATSEYEHDKSQVPVLRFNLVSAVGLSSFYWFFLTGLILPTLSDSLWVCRKCVYYRICQIPPKQWANEMNVCPVFENLFELFSFEAPSGTIPRQAVWSKLETKIIINQHCRSRQPIAWFNVQVIWDLVCKQ